MFERHVSARLSAYIDKRVSSSEAHRIETHLKQCPLCESECERIRGGMAALEQLEPVEAPPELWSSIESAFAETRRHRTVGIWRFALAAAVAVICLAGAAYWQFAHRQKPDWEVVRIDGSPAIGSKHIDTTGRIAAGDWVETDASSRARIEVGNIGSVDVGPNTRVRRIGGRPGESRLSLARGDISAKIMAPPRLFLVDTSSGTAVDLGCEYTMHTGDDGSGLLRVTLGWVSFEWKGRESLVPAGASCRTQPRIGPGTPCFDDASDTFKKALSSFDFEHGGADALAVILVNARVKDTMTLWHLLSRVSAARRSTVLDRMTALVPLPSSIPRERILNLDSAALDEWREELSMYSW